MGDDGRTGGREQPLVLDGGRVAAQGLGGHLTAGSSRLTVGGGSGWDNRDLGPGPDWYGCVVCGPVASPTRWPRPFQWIGTEALVLL